MYWVLGVGGLVGLVGLAFWMGKVVSERIVERTKETAVQPTPAAAQEKFPKVFLVRNEGFGSWEFYYVVKDVPVVSDVPITSADGTKIGTAESAVWVEYYNVSGEKKEILVAQRVRLPDGTEVPGIEETQKPDGNLVVGTSIVKDLEEDFREKEKQNPNIQRNYVLEKFVKEYYDSRKDELDKFLADGDPEIGLIIPVGYLGTGEPQSGWE